MSWTVEFVNPATGDDFVMFLKEIDDARRAAAAVLDVALRRVPEGFDGLCKALSLDMRVTDPAWIAMKLRKLLNYSESQRIVHGTHARSERAQTCPSTIAYLAQLVIHRFAMLGILTEDGMPVAPQACWSSPSARRRSAAAHRRQACPECGNPR